ncbi:toxin-antitoxin system TumE family protein [Desulfoferrobacter suflitae]|uniref:toxin-antitoxin system TumE family protein n=1 Tax=Desulfoferrobacter suflitae TaxID=2865782 RepID=UPI002164EE49|nr:DUF6516 family protein [Desulfoferrobacter suflitae]MCK8603303.1 DUF6516 family protein [Desulfoferrobacter suflitae]
MRVLRTEARNSDIILSFSIKRFEQAGSSLRLRMEIDLADGSKLYVRETVMRGMKRKYAYHWQDSAGRLLIRWDNAPDWEVESFPHHCPFLLLSHSAFRGFDEREPGKLRVTWLFHGKFPLPSIRLKTCLDLRNLSDYCTIIVKD